VCLRINRGGNIFLFGPSESWFFRGGSWASQVYQDRYKAPHSMIYTYGSLGMIMEVMVSHYHATIPSASLLIALRMLIWFMRLR
jgi:hypothetical protein